MDIRKLYEENKHIIEAMAKQVTLFCSSGSFDQELFEDLISEGNYHFCICAEKYDPEIGPFSKYLSSCLFFVLRRYIKERRKEVEEIESPEFFSDISSQEQEYEKVEIYHSLSRKAKECILELFTAEEITYTRIRWKNTEHISRGKFINYLKKEKGWSQKQIMSVFREINTVVLSA